MKWRVLAGFIICGLPSVEIRAQAADPELLREVSAVRVEVARSNAAIRQYTWTEHTEVLVKGSVKSSSAVICRYDVSGKLTRTPVASPKEEELSRATSKRPMVRKKSDMQDYIERAISRIHNYVPPKPEQMEYLLQNGFASLAKSQTGQPEVRFKNYFERGDSLVFTYDPDSKRLVRASISSSLGSPKDPVTLDVAFETLPDGVNHVTSSDLNAKARKVQVRTRNTMYQKLTD